MIGLGIDRHARLGRLGNAVMKNQVQMNRDEREDDRGNEKDVEREEAAERRATESFPRENEMRDQRADHRHPRRLLRRDDHRPHRVLIPAQELAGEAHADGEDEQHRAGQPVELARILVASHQEDLAHVDADQQHHRGRAEVMHPAQQIAEQRARGDEVQRVVGLAGRGDVRRSPAPSRSRPGS